MKRVVKWQPVFFGLLEKTNQKQFVNYWKIKLIYIQLLAFAKREVI
jgi:hypothetical protein